MYRFVVSDGAQDVWPKGIGALSCAHETAGQNYPQIDGGGHERGMRSGTLNFPDVGLGKLRAGQKEMKRG